MKRRHSYTRIKNEAIFYRADKIIFCIFLSVPGKIGVGMAKNKTVVSEMASALGTVTARVENLTPKRALIAKHTKAKSAPVEAASTASVARASDVLHMSVQEEIALVAYLNSEMRGFQGGSPEEDWLRAEQEVQARRG